MTKIRRGPTAADNFTILANSHVRDETLSWGARGLLAWLCSHAEGYEITENTIVAAGPSGRDGVRVMLRELEGSGYLRRERAPIVTGGSTVDYVLTDPRATENPTLGNDGKSDSRADQAEQEVSAGEPNDGKSDSRSSLEDQEKTKTPSVSKRAPRAERATRVPEDFTPDEKMRTWFVDEKLTAVIDGKREHEKFMDYWLGVPGSKGRKLDWPRTWRNWMREAADRAMRHGGYRPSGTMPGTPGNALMTTSGAPYRPSTTDQRIAQGQALAAKYREQGL